jgi:DNA-binding NtrC family response regulator
MAQPPVTGKEGILLIEDDYDLRELLCDMLTALGHRVYAAQDGEEALALFRQHMDALDLVVSDMVMPGKGGREIFEEMSRLKPGIPCLFVSGYGVVLEEAGPVNGGRVGLVQKPFSADALSRKIREILDGRGHSAVGTKGEGPGVEGRRRQPPEARNVEPFGGEAGKQPIEISRKAS